MPDISQLVLASGNRGKLKELQQLLAGRGIELLSQADFAVSDAEETGLSFVENAIIKARHACDCTGLPSIADDSGLEVDALSGQPGIYSARYAGMAASDADNNAKLLAALKDVPDELRTARFQCVLVFMRHAKDPVPEIFQGSWNGIILRQPVGENGFGYDPLFWVPDYRCSSAELPAEVKNKISHRGQAIKRFIESWSC